MSQMEGTPEAEDALLWCARNPPQAEPEAEAEAEERVLWCARSSPQAEAKAEAEAEERVLWFSPSAKETVRQCLDCVGVGVCGQRSERSGPRAVGETWDARGGSCGRS